jgi:hypothetical protein
MTMGPSLGTRTKKKIRSGQSGKPETKQRRGLCKYRHLLQLGNSFRPLCIVVLMQLVFFAAGHGRVMASLQITTGSAIAWDNDIRMHVK